MAASDALAAIRHRLFTHSTSGRVLQLDILRGFAILLVMGRHPVIFPEATHYLYPVAQLLLVFGWTGVELFFVLSGFLIGGLLFNEIKKTGRLDVQRFLIRRGFKIWPSYYLFLVYVALFSLYLALTHHIGSIQTIAMGLVPNLLHIQNYFHTLCPHTWSLAVEEHFYLTLPFLLWLLLRFAGEKKGLHRLPIIAVGVIIFCTVLRCINTLHCFPNNNYYYTQTRLDGLFWGVLLAYWYRFRPELFDRLAAYRCILFILGLLLVSPMLVLDIDKSPFVTSLGLNFLTFGFGFIMIAVITTPLSEGRAGRLMQTKLMRGIARIGFFSYPIYLWHRDAGIYLLEVCNSRVKVPLQPDLRWLIVTALYIIIAFLQGALFSLLIEKPMLRLREKIFPDKTTASRNAVPESA